MKECPLVLCLTNTVAANFTANALLAVGARPAMVEDASEAMEMIAFADALLVNIGTVTGPQAEIMRRAVTIAFRRGTPWVLDPVGVQMLPARKRLAFELMAFKPALIRANAAEAEALGKTGFPTLATGEVDVISPSGERIEGGTPMLQSVTATGCAQGAVCAAFLGRGVSPEEAAKGASLLMKRAGEQAWERAQTPGSFQVALLDALWELTHG